VIVPDVVIRPILPATLASVNHNASSIPKAPVDALGIGYSVTTRKW
jgi:hypothetical protein